MVKTYQEISREAFSRTNLKTLDNLFLKEIEKGAACSPFVSNAILGVAKKVYNLEGNKDEGLKIGQMKVVGLLLSEPAGKPLKECQLGECIITLDAGQEDQEIRQTYGVCGLRRARILRITTEAYEQGIALTQEDLAYRLLNCGIRTIRRDIAQLRKEGIFVPTRGQQKDLGPGTSHKVLAVKMLLERYQEQEIARRLYHTLSSIERYTVNFARIVLLTKKKIPIKEIAFLVQISERLVKDYQKLYTQFNDEAHRARLEEIIARGQPFIPVLEKGETGKKKKTRRLKC